STAFDRFRVRSRILREGKECGSEERMRPRCEGGEVKIFARATFVIVALFAVNASAAQTGQSSPRDSRPAARPVNVDEAQDFQDLNEIAGYYMDEALLKTKDMQPTCFDCDPAQPNAPSQACRDTYSDLYSKDTLDFRYVFGYIDDYNAEDGAARAAAIENLMRPCGTVLQGESGRTTLRGACGFTYETEDDDEVLVKTMRGPDGKEKKIRLTTVHSSISPNLAKNRGPMAAAQAVQSRRAREVFESGLNGSDMLIYVGHGRDGGGPSFEPPRLLPSGKPNLDWYNRTHQSRDAMFSRLSTATRPPKLLGMFACYTERYFADGVRNASKRNGQPQTGFVGSTGLTALQAMYAQSFAMLDNVLAMRCETQFRNAMHPVTEVVSDPRIPPAIQTPPTIRGVWDRRIPTTTAPAPSRPAVTAPAPVTQEPVPTGETVRPPRPPVLLTEPIRPGGAISQPRSTTPEPGVR
ncbi:MAG: hypothetical protein V4760_15580, partial [Bdellovibrionota bacterium]